MQHRLNIAALSLLLAAVPATAAPPHAAQDLAYGEALYSFYQDDYFTSGVQLLAAMERQRLPHHQHDGELLLGGLQLHYGMHAQARRTLERLLPANIPPSLRDQAWLQLAKLAYRRGDNAGAIAALQQLGGHLPPEFQAEARQLHALALLAQEQPQQALEVLADTTAPAPWDMYLEFDRAVALLRSGDTDAALAGFNRLGERKTQDEEQSAVRDRANLAAGYAALRADRPAAAQPYFRRIHLHGDTAPMALLGAGWAATGVAAHAEALALWGRLGELPPHDAAVLEGLLALPYAYAQLGDAGRAAEYYERAVAAYRAEHGRLAAVRREIEAGALPATLVAQERHVPAGPLRDVEMPLDTPVTGYLPQLLARHDFQNALRDYLDLRRLRDNLERWAGSLNAFDTMLETRQARFAQVLPRIDARLAALDIAALERRRAALDEEVQRLRREQDVWGAAPIHERELLAEVQRLQRRILSLYASPQQQAYRERVQRLYGVLYWQAHAALPQRLWDKTKQVAALSQPLAEAAARRDALQHAHAFADGRIGNLGTRIAAQRTRIERLRPRLDQTIAAQAARLEQLALHALDERAVLLDSYLIQAQFALARVYDSAQLGEQP